ncbi:hypothetical protein ACFY00_24515 [Kitasatospora sp. NPDC001540]|uniref:hypothetical protein n=1 Tax=Kitasatospora sp. NPDC001540 TaxID=3364014 RepID=UPI00367D3F60
MSEIVHGRAHLGDECRARIREGLWSVLQAGLAGTADEAGTAADVLERSEIHEARSAFHQDLLRRRARAGTKRGR